MTKLLNISVVSCTDSSLRKPPKLKPKSEQVLKHRAVCRAIRSKDASCHAVTYLKAVCVQVYRSLTERFMWSINSDSLISVVRVEPAFASR